LDNWSDVLKQFVKVMPVDYKRVLTEMKNQKETDLDLRLEA
jgi:glutamate synthase domain-containing protein 3